MLTKTNAKAESGATSVGKLAALFVTAVAFAAISTLSVNSDDAPDVNTPGRVTNYVASAGAATLYLELYDSVSGEIIARIIDRRNMQDYGYARWANSVTNRADAKRMFKRWADLLRQGMDEQRKEAGLPPIKAP